MTHSAIELMVRARYCALITMNDEGLPDVRLMDPFSPEEDLTVWCGTNPKNRKVSQIHSKPIVVLYYFDSCDPGYVVIKGLAEIIDDRDEKLNHWKEEWEAFYTDREEGYMPIRVRLQSMEITDVANGIIGDKRTWKVPGVELRQH